MTLGPGKMFFGLEGVFRNYSFIFLNQIYELKKKMTVSGSTENVP